MSPDAMDPKPFPAPHTPQGDSIGWAKRNSFIQRSPDRNNPHVPTFRVETCGVNRCPETSFRRSTTIG